MLIEYTQDYNNTLIKQLSTDVMPKSIENRRYDLLDLIRGQAIVLMFTYHLCFGLAQMGVIQAQFSTDLFWISFRTLIILLFLNLVGVGLFLSRKTVGFTTRYVKRMALIAIYAGLITWVSYLVRPNYFVYFGILHHIFVASLLGLLFVTYYRLNLILGLSALFAGTFLRIENFNLSYLHWLGFSNTRIPSDDFAPLLPWFGFVLIGIFLGHLFFQENKRRLVISQYLENWKAKSYISKTLCWAGRQSLHLYFIHFISFYIAVYIFT